MSRTLTTVKDRETELIRRKAKASSTRAEVHSICEAAERANAMQCTGCLSGLVRAVFGNRAVTVSESSQAEVATVGSASKSSTMFARSTPQKKLQEASDALRARAERLELKVAEERARAVRLAKTDKQAALKALKKSKQIQAQADSATAALDTLESQQDLLEHAALQQTITSALGKQMKSIKGTKKLLSNAEAASESAIELQDLVDDVGHILTESNANANGAYDEDDLLEELQKMTEDDGGGGGGSLSAVAAPAPAQGCASSMTREELRSELMRAEARALEQQEEARAAMRDAPAVPSTNAVRTERQHLLPAMG